MKACFFSLFLFFSMTSLLATTLHIGPDHPYKSLGQAAGVAQPGDILLVHNGTYSQREDLFALNGTAEKPILILAEEAGKVIYQGQSEAWHLSSCSHLYIHGFVFTGQTGNGVNIDDGGLDDASAHHIILEKCRFLEMDASGNNDMLKLSGLYHFNIKACIFSDGSEGGSGIDMVGCHFGTIEDNRFERMGSNSIQAKGGTQYLTIRRNVFEDGGQRAVNLGGSTGLPYFRPIDAPFEAADLLVHSNVFIRGWAPVAYVGSVRVKVANNTIYKPENWVFRILQETVDTNRFASCGDNHFVNNIVFFDSGLSRIVNIGPNTRPESFHFANNLWYQVDDPDFSGPDLPASESDPVIQQDPVFRDIDLFDFEPEPGSPALGKGLELEGAYSLDFDKRYFAGIPAIGAFQTGGVHQDETLPGTEWWYGFDAGYMMYRAEEKYSLEDQEMTRLYQFIHIGDATGDYDQAGIFTRDRKVYFKNWFIEPFQLLYDFNLEPGDTMSSMGGTLISRIDSVSYRYLAGDFRKVLYTSPADSLEQMDLSFGMPGEIIEGIGSVQSLPEGSYPNDWSQEPMHLEKLRCYFQPGTEGMYEIHFQDVPCDSTSLGTNDPYAELQLWPNPSRDRVCLKGDLSGLHKIMVSGSSGQILAGYTIGPGESTPCFDVSFLSPGMYFFRVYGEKHILIRKILIL